MADEPSKRLHTVSRLEIVVILSTRIVEHQFCSLQILRQGVHQSLFWARIFCLSSHFSFENIIKKNHRSSNRNLWWMNVAEKRWIYYRPEIIVFIYDSVHFSVEIEKNSIRFFFLHIKRVRIVTMCLLKLIFFVRHKLFVCVCVMASGWLIMSHRYTRHRGFSRNDTFYGNTNACWCIQFIRLHLIHKKRRSYLLKMDISFGVCFCDDRYVVSIATLQNQFEIPRIDRLQHVQMHTRIIIESIR